MIPKLRLQNLKYTPRNSVLAIALLCIGLARALFAADLNLDTVKYVLPEQTVIGTRSQTNWLHNPSAVTALSATDQPTRRLIGVAEHLLLVPGLVALPQFGTDDMRLSMRGMGMRSNSGERSVRVLYDGIPESEPDGQTRLEGIETGNIEQVEVQRGAGSSLYGNAAGGVINLRTMEGLAETGMKLDAQGGGFGFSKVKLTAGTRAAKEDSSITFSLDLKRLKFAADLGTSSEGGLASLSQIKSDGYRVHSKYESQLVNGSWTVKANAFSNLRVLAYFTNARAELPGTLTRAQYESNPDQADPQYIDRDVRRYTRKGRFGFAYQRVFGERVLLSFTPYAALKKLDRARETGKYQTITRYVLGGMLQGQWNTLIAERKFQLVAGLDEQFMDGPVTQYVADHGRRTEELVSQEQERQWEQGMYAEGNLTLSEHWEATLGGRVERVELTGMPLNEVSTEKKEEAEPAFIPRAGLRYAFNPETVLFGAVYGGYETATLMEREKFDEAFGTELKPQKSLTAELGLRAERKLSWSDAQFEATLYRMTVDDYIMPAPGQGEKLWVNAGQTVHQGIEVSAKLIRQGLGYVGVAGSIGDFHFAKYVTDSTNYNDKKLPGVSPNLFNAIVRWTPRDYFYAELSSRFSGSAFVNTENTDKADGFMVLNAAIGGRLPVKALAAAWHLGVQNLADEKYVSYIQVNDSQDRFFGPGLPQTVFGGISIGTGGVF